MRLRDKHTVQQRRKLGSKSWHVLAQNGQKQLGCRGAIKACAVARSALGVAFFGMLTAVSGIGIAREQLPSGQPTATQNAASESANDAENGSAAAQASGPASVFASAPANVSANKAEGAASNELQNQTLSSAPRPLYYYTETRQNWYGWQVLLVDVPLLGAFFFTLREQQRAVGYTSLALFGIGGPIVHGAHQRWMPAVVSGLARLTVGGAALVTGPWIGGAIDRDASDDKTRAAVTLVAGLGVSLLDSLLLGYEDVEQQVMLSAIGQAKPREARKNRRLRAWWVPSAGLLSAGGWMGFSGGF